MKNKNVQIVSRSDIPTILNIIPTGSIFSVCFLKKNGEERLLVGRKGVHKYLNPNPSRPRPEMPANEITVYDLQNKGYRMFNTDTTTKIKACHIEFEVGD